MSYKGKFVPKNKSKYRGDSSSIIWRSLWERGVMNWLDQNSDVKEWSSEEVVIPYLCETDKRVHRYFTDFYIHFNDGRQLLIEVKPDSQTKPPKQTATKRTRKYISESLQYVKNVSKWKAAKDFCEKNGWEFQIWTEKTLKQMGIRIIDSTGDSAFPRIKRRTRRKIKK